MSDEDEDDDDDEEEEEEGGRRGPVRSPVKGVRGIQEIRQSRLEQQHLPKSPVPVCSPCEDSGSVLAAFIEGEEEAEGSPTAREEAERAARAKHDTAQREEAMARRLLAEETEQGRTMLEGLVMRDTPKNETSSDEEEVYTGPYPRVVNTIKK